MRPPLISLGLISATALAYEILLMRLFSVIQWHHFAYMIISLALLGYGISGTLVSIFQNSLKRHFNISYSLLLLLFSLSSFSCFFLAQSFPFNPEAILWDASQVLYLFSIFLLLSLPFLLAASAICLVFIQFPQSIAKIYSIDLLGAGAGSLAIIGVLFLVHPLNTLFFISLFALLSALIATRETDLNFIKFNNVASKLFSTIFLSTVLILSVSVSFWSLQISPYKDLSKTLNITNTQIIQQRSSPLGLLTVVESKTIPFRHAPGLSLYNTNEPLKQLALYTDAANMTAITQYPDELNQLAYLDQVSSALPYHLSDINDLLIVGAGGGSDILQALYHQASSIDAVELNHQIIDLMMGPYAQYSGQLYSRDNVHIYSEDIRGFLNRKKAHYDLIQISLMDSFNASASGLYALNESYLYTIEAIDSYLQHLNPQGYLAISRWVKTPPRDAIKMFATAIEVLKQNGIQNIDQHMMLIRSWQTSTLLIKPSPFSPEEVNSLKQFTQSRGFDVVWYPGIKTSEVNQFNRFREPWLHQAIVKLLDTDHNNEFFQDYKYTITPASDDKPFFHHFFKWSSLKEWLSLRNQGGLMLVEMGYMVLLSTLLMAIISSIILIILPLFAIHNQATHKKSLNLSFIGHIKLFIYFFSIGLAFLFIEIAMMQKMILFLHHPIYAIPVVLTAFLVFAGLGSAWTQTLLARLSARQLLFRAVISLIIIAIGYSVFISAIFEAFSSYNIVIKIIISLILIAPLALAMGIPMPLALNELSKNNSHYIPWAWGINGCASVISAVLASLLAIHFGFNQVIVAGLLLYGICYLTFIVPEKKQFSPLQKKA